MGFVVGAGLLVGGLALLMLWRRLSGPGARTRKLPFTSIADINPGAVVKLVGTARGIGPPLKAPLSGRLCLGYQVIAESSTRHRHRTTWTRVQSSTELQDCMLVDRTGSALIRGAQVELVIGAGKLSVQPPPPGEQYASWRWSEGIIELGELVLVCGVSTHVEDMPAAVAPAGYRDAPRWAVMASHQQHQLLVAGDDSGVG